ncbi:MAG: hypothetical protein JW937_05365, partial [Candidatus Omnitrophica bacterium]|nr:hypothetical protein [Candidatus Omnitrophota bacterium]
MRIPEWAGLSLEQSRYKLASEVSRIRFPRGLRRRILVFDGARDARPSRCEHHCNVEMRYARP